MTVADEAFLLDLDLRLMELWEVKSLEETPLMTDNDLRELFACCVRYAYLSGYKDRIKDGGKLLKDHRMRDND